MKLKNNTGESINNITAILSVVALHPHRTKNGPYPKTKKHYPFYPGERIVFFNGSHNFSAPLKQRIKLNIKSHFLLERITLIKNGFLTWWALQDSNLRPIGYEPTALPTELRALNGATDGNRTHECRSHNPMR
jgi:hypothetical protein